MIKISKGVTSYRFNELDVIIQNILGIRRSCIGHQKLLTLRGAPVLAPSLGELKLPMFRTSIRGASASDQLIVIASEEFRRASKNATTSMSQS